MLKIKRYVYEFSNDMIRRTKENINPAFPEMGLYRIERIEKYVNACRAGLITEYETMRAIINVMEMDTIPGGM